MNLLEVSQLLFVYRREKELQSDTSLRHMRQYPLLRWQQRLDELRHLFDHLYEAIIFLLLLNDLNLRCTSIMDSQVADGDGQVAVDEVVTLGDFPDLGSLEEIELYHVFGYLVLDEVLGNEQERIGLKRYLVLLELLHLFIFKTEQKGHQGGVGAVNHLCSHRVHEGLKAGSEHLVEAALFGLLVIGVAVVCLVLVWHSANFELLG